jgi:hypothetical protein
MNYVNIEDDTINKLLGFNNRKFYKLEEDISEIVFYISPKVINYNDIFPK